MHRDPGDETNKCSCGKDLKPGADECYVCLGESPPNRADYIRERVADFSRVGTEEWKVEMRELWSDWYYKGGF